MRLLRSVTDDAASRPGPCAFTLGVFDGMHLGHQMVVRAVVAAARARDIAATVMTFDPHPREVLTGSPPPILLPLSTRVEEIAALGVDNLIVLPFTRALAETEAADFLRDVLLEKVGVRVFVLGQDTCFGKDQRGDARFLRECATAGGFEVIATEPVRVAGELAASSNVRAAIAAADLDRAARLLGRPYALVGPVGPGRRRGALLGFPTANLEVGAQVLPPAGVYAGEALLAPATPGGASPTPWRAVANVGVAPTFAGAAGASGPLTVEAHLLDFSGDLYGRTLTLRLWRRLRPEMKFPSAEALCAQIARDALAARETRPPTRRS
ncbi:MAG: riboflavin biosynthesis protein RibF [Planctomycetes bacterium]|nr:riboflavin biosynthesis protein RibF [Planctomycetota bacterium]